MRHTVLYTLVLILSACTNPINYVTYQDYKQQGVIAEARGDWATSEIAYYRAAENVRIGNLEPALQSNSLFDLGRVKRKVRKFEESETILKQLLVLDENLYGNNAFLTSLTISELAATYFEAKKYNQGVPLMIRLESMIPLHIAKYSVQGRKFFKQLFEKYAEVLGDQPYAERFNKVASSL